MLDAVEQRMESVQRSLEKKGAPDALFSEQMVLGAVLSGNAEMDDISLVNPSSFSLEKHRIIYHRMLDLHRRGIAVGYASLAQSLTDHDELQSVGGLSYLTDLHLDVPSRLRIDHHLELIEQRAQAVRFLDAVLTESQRVIHDPNSYQEAKEKILQAAKHEVARTDEEKRMFSGRDIVGDRINSFYGKQTPGVQTGIGILDKQTYGLHEGELIILGARPSDGKTALLTQVCANAAFQGCNTQIISLEMGKDQLLQRTVCQLASASYHLLRCGQLTPEERLRITEQDSRIGSAPFYISDAVTWNLLEIKSHLKRQLAAGTPVDMLAIDYLQLMPITHSGKNDRRDLELGEVTRGLKLIAKEFKCRIILLSQLNRDNEKQNRKPTKSDLRDSGSIEADADLIWLLWHDKARYKEGQRYREAEIILEKQRNGPVGPVKVYFDMVSACFVDR